MSCSDFITRASQCNGPMLSINVLNRPDRAHPMGPIDMRLISYYIRREVENSEKVQDRIQEGFDTQASVSSSKQSEVKSLDIGSPIRRHGDSLMIHISCNNEIDKVTRQIIFAELSSNPLELQHADDILDLTTQEKISEEFQSTFPSSLQKSTSLKLKDGSWISKLPPQEKVSEDVSEPPFSSVVQSNSLKKKNVLKEVSEIGTEEEISGNVQDPSTSRVVHSNPSNKENRQGPKNFRDFLTIPISDQTSTSEEVPKFLTSSVEHPKLLRPSKGIDVRNIPSSVKEYLNISTYYEDLPDDLKETHEIFKTMITNTNNLHQFFSQRCFRKKKSWSTYLGERSGPLRPYKKFMQNMSTVMRETPDENMSNSLIAVEHLHLNGFERGSILYSTKFMRHKKAIIDSLGLFCEVLKDKKLVYLNRLRAIGIIQYYKNHFPLGSGTLETEFSHHALSFQTALELFFTRDHEEAVEAKMLPPSTMSHKEIGFSIRECFARASFMSRHEECIKEGLLSDHPQGIHVMILRFLLGSWLAIDGETVQKFISELAGLIIGNTLTNKETNYAIAVVCHLWKMPIYKEYIYEWLDVDQFYTNFFKPKAQEAIKLFLDEKDKHLKKGKKAYVIVIDLLEDNVSSSNGLVLTLLDEIKSDSLSMNEKEELLHLLNAKFVLQPDLRPILFEKMYHDEIDLHVAEVWIRIGSQQQLVQTPLDDLDTIAFRILLSAKLQALENENMKFKVS
ncbi:uncharacterized protein MELLADRAFT_104416 [Melampsora larici-populina 98AG31]|uniref:Uncharacterized protein n=1 Tax=Melampsora larici-populina (strain 98AG31 / pathotype 3-4-7) TaxID=747676 RepID=F4REL7_MELLP|nr:uncharacterized protein MELLADRAFT_104416 [Melampsora larici-populina 98AG31]EGG09256.1 hypothetical protein MELLADRAFT_104416 [Melampsora larici-populina 98AG31]